MFRFHVVQAREGDALVLEYGSDAEPRFLLIDGGPSRTWERHLGGVLRAVAAKNPVLDLAILSHVDNDHVIGLLDYFADLQAGEPGLPRPRALWHNSFSTSLDPDSRIAPRLKALSPQAAAMPNAAHAVMGISEGQALRVRALAASVPVNPDVPGDLVAVDTMPEPVRFGSLSLTIVGPTRANLDKLRTQWLAWLEKHEAAIGTGDPMVMANSDRSVPNLSSIMALAEADGRTILLTGDGRSDHLLEGLGAAGLLDAEGKLHVDVLKYPHHGSSRNMTRKFLELVTADTYVASANGRYNNPEIGTLIWTVEAARADGRSIEIMVTNTTPATEKLLEEYPPDEYGYTMTVLPEDAHAHVIELAS